MEKPQKSGTNRLHFSETFSSRTPFKNCIFEVVRREKRRGNWITRSPGGYGDTTIVFFRNRKRSRKKINERWENFPEVGVCRRASPKQGGGKLKKNKNKNKEKDGSEGEKSHPG